MPHLSAGNLARPSVLDARTQIGETGEPVADPRSPVHPSVNHRRAIDMYCSLVSRVGRARHDLSSCPHAV